MLYKTTNEKLKEINNIGFAKEKGLQTFVENNMQQLIGYKFIATEFAIDTYRFDSVAFDEENNAFVIVEYKRGKNESLVDPGYAYLKTLMDRKADFVLLYNEVFKQSKNKSDFDWSQTRIVFISPNFTQYQIDATAFGNMPFELYEIKKYEENLYNVEKINKSKKINEKTLEKALESSTMQEVNKEIKVYTEQDHFKWGGKNVVDLYEEIKERMQEWGDFSIEPKKVYIAFKGKTNIIDFQFHKNYITIYLNIKYGELKDPLKLMENCENVGHNGNGGYRINLTNNKDIDYLLTLIKQSWEINS